MLQHELFYSTDSEERWINNTTNHIDKLLASGWDTNSVIDYKFDSHGFRNDTDEIPRDSILILGCSFAQGVGLRKEQTFGSILSEKTGIPHLNYAMQGTGPLATFYIAEEFIKEIKPKYICYLRSIITRLDIYEPEENHLSFTHDPYTSVNRTRKVPYRSPRRHFSFDQHWLTRDNFVSKVNDCVELAITKIAEDNNAQLAILDSCAKYKKGTEYEENLLQKFYIRARDLMHEGPNKHEFWAHKFLQELKLDR